MENPFRARELAELKKLRALLAEHRDEINAALRLKYQQKKDVH